MLEKAARLTAAADMTVLTGRAIEGGGTYRPIADALVEHLRDVALSESESDELRVYRWALQRIVPGLGPRYRGGVCGAGGRSAPRHPARVRCACSA